MSALTEVIIRMLASSGQFNAISLYSKIQHFRKTMREEENEELYYSNQAFHRGVSFLINERLPSTQGTGNRQRNAVHCYTVPFAEVKPGKSFFSFAAAERPPPFPPVRPPPLQPARPPPFPP